MADASVLGRVLWYELLTTGVDDAIAFYSKIIGWTTTPFAGSPQPYHLWMRGDHAPVGGVMAIPPGMNFPPHWGMFVGVPRLEDGVARVVALGGSTLSDVIDIPTVGRMRTMKDPQGALFSLYEPAAVAPESDAQPGLGDVAWHELFTSDANAALAFYTDLFGWKGAGSMDMGAMGPYHMFGRAVPMGGIMNKPAEMSQAPAFWGFYFRVPDVHAGADRVKTHGGQVLNGPMQVPGGDWVVNCLDPQGAAFSLYHKA